MGTQTIGQNIANLRKEKGVKQDELAQALNISAQAVSKWENGGTPDIELIPAIADFFGVSTDTLFGRDEVSGAGLEKVINTAIQSVKWEERVEKAFEICSMIECGLFGEPGTLNFKKQEANIEAHEEIFSSMITDNGLTDMGIGKRIRYFIAVPEIEDKKTALFADGIDYTALFSDLSQKDIFDSIVYILKRKDQSKSFTKNLLVKGLEIAPERAGVILSRMKKYGILRSQTLEIDDAEEEIYNIGTTATQFVYLLIFAHNLIQVPNSWCYYNIGRGKPLL
jgi:transcriptional regulator with XRE-family HTH domain